MGGDGDEIGFDFVHDFEPFILFDEVGIEEADTAILGFECAIELGVLKGDYGLVGEDLDEFKFGGGVGEAGAFGADGDDAKQLATGTDRDIKVHIHRFEPRFFIIGDSLEGGVEV